MNFHYPPSHLDSPWSFTMCLYNLLLSSLQEQDGSELGELSFDEDMSSGAEDEGISNVACANL